MHHVLENSAGYSYKRSFFDSFQFGARLKGGLKGPGIDPGLFSPDEKAGLGDRKFIAFFFAASSVFTFF